VSPDFKAKRHTNRFWLGLCPRPGQLNGAYFYGKGKGKRRGEERKEGREAKRRGWDPFVCIFKFSLKYLLFIQVSLTKKVNTNIRQSFTKL